MCHYIYGTDIVEVSMHPSDMASTSNVRGRIWRRDVAKKTVKKPKRKRPRPPRGKWREEIRQRNRRRAPPRPRPPKGPVWQWSAVETAAAIRAGAISSVEVVEAHLARMRAVNPKLNAVVVDLSEEALKAAKIADSAAARRNSGLLHGVPITIKENADYEGRPNPNGVPAQMNIIAPSDAPVVRNLKKAGAIVIGLTNTPEFSFRGFTDNPLHGLTLNPWDPEITCGGSSGGAGCVGGGRDRRHRAWQRHRRLLALAGALQRDRDHQADPGPYPRLQRERRTERPMLAHLMSAQGPLARSVGDVRLALEVMSARDPRDPWWVPAPLAGPKPKGPIKVALAKLPDDMDVDPSVRAALRQAADHLERAGYRVSEVEVPDINGVWQTWCDIITNETVTLQEAAMLKVASEDFHIAWNGIKAKANMLDLAGWMRATAARNGHIRAWQLFFEEYPVVLAPTTVKPTPGPREDAISGERAQEIFWNDLRFISAINVLGLPSAVVPVALHQGKPIGVQLISGRYREDLALDAAAAIEKRAGMLVRQLWEKIG